eukprot:TRINITY_DN4944_c0_g1_i1.p1 TRINITY_DN4944_c0_g1~~TRINITY_DN4944_c0_g1_i1.p1  ORF type:complete len:116 (+),score=26.70 TRINITY_DN4944_c0_g1_i1:90-437(+)
MASSVSRPEDFIKEGKVVVIFKNTGDAPPIKPTKFKLLASCTFQNVIDFLRKQLAYSTSDSLFIFINSTFQPNPEEVVLNLFKCFHVNGTLVVNYCTTPAWGEKAEGSIRLFVNG